MIPTKFQVNWLFSSGEAKNRFSILPSQWPTWISDRNDFSSFKMVAMVAILDFRLEQFQLYLIYKSSCCFLPSFKSTGLLVQKKKQKNDFQYCRHGGQLGFLIGMILAIFDLQVTTMLPSFKSIGLLVQEKKQKKDF